MPSSKSNDSKSLNLAPRASLLKKYKFNNPYINFLMEFLSRSDNRCLGTQTELFRIAGQQWRHMSACDRAPFIECAQYNKAHNKQPKRRRAKTVCSYCGRLTRTRKREAKHDLPCDSSTMPPANEPQDVDDMFESDSAMSSVSSF